MITETFQDRNDGTGEKPIYREAKSFGMYYWVDSGATYMKQMEKDLKKVIRVCL